MYRWKPSKAAKAAFANQMQEIDKFCIEKGISASASRDSYYFTIRGQKYRVSNHTVEASNAAATDDLGQRRREAYHPGGREEDTFYIHAGKTRIIEIYRRIEAGTPIDHRGNAI